MVYSNQLHPSSHHQKTSSRQRYPQASPASSYSQYSRPRCSRGQISQPTMSGFLSSQAERVLLGETDDSQLFDQQFMESIATPFVDENSNWAHAHESPSGHDYFHPQAYMPSMTTTAAHIDPSATLSIDPTTGYYIDQSAGYHSGPSVASSTDIQPNPYMQSGLPMTSSGSFAFPPNTSSSPSRSTSPHAPDLSSYGSLNADKRTWRCAYPGCSSKAVFVRPCDLRKHFNRHSKQFFCRHENCPQSTQGGFSSKKDRARHEAKHNPGVECEWEGCDRIFSRVDNMRNHMQRSK